MDKIIFSNKILYEKYSIIPECERCCLLTLAKDWVKRKPFKNRKVLLNCHLTLVTLIMLDLLQLAGAEISAIGTSELTIHDDIVDVIKKSGITYLMEETLLEKQKNKYFDILFDCGAGLLNIIYPKYGTAELTHCYGKSYANASYPIINVDDTFIKEIETHYGTGDGFVRAFKHLIEGTIKFVNVHGTYNVLTIKNDPFYRNKKFILFGFGKVGSGIIWGLKRAGVTNENIYIVDLSPVACKKAEEMNIPYIQLTHDKATLEKIKQETKDAYCIITATGIENAVSNYFGPEDFSENLYLANMGTPDEFGDKFSESRVMNRKKAVNFAIQYPTKVKYLDPIFQSLLISGELLITEKLLPGLNRFPIDIDKSILEKWQFHHQKDH